ncbi:MAG: hypothetical protein NVSMB14_03500 [Isosphaeraceae bacterium]
MRKFATEPGDIDLNRRLSPCRFWTTIVLGLILTPLIYDGTKICLARWQSMYGPAVEFETPAIDALTSTFHALYSATRDQTSEPFRNVPWSPPHVLGIAAVWVACGSMLLLRRH